MRISLGRAALVAATALAAGGCTSTRTVTGQFLSGASTPLATTVDTSSGVWAAVPMGQLSDPQNTYWQLLYRPNGSAHWVDDVASLGTATTGGVNIGAAGPSLVAGVQADEHLTFSPVIETGDSGKSWQDGLLPTALARMPQALAVDPTGDAAAIVHGQQLLRTTPTSLGSWNPVPFPAGCGIAALDAVRWVGSRFLVGATCRQPGVAGVLDLSSGRLVGPKLPAGDGPVAVVALAGGSTKTTALLATQGRWVVASAGPALDDWAESPPLTLDPATIESIVAEDDGGFLLLSDTALAEYEPSTATWAQLPAPPAGTATVAQEEGGRLSALVVNGTNLVDWELAPGGNWSPTTTLQVPILYGSTS